MTLNRRSTSYSSEGSHVEIRELLGAYHCSREKQKLIDHAQDSLAKAIRWMKATRIKRYEGPFGILMMVGNRHTDLARLDKGQAAIYVTFMRPYYNDPDRPKKDSERARFLI